ncbi:helix-turn-helix transcriptional regulator [Actinoplanes sp. NBC_00393]
MPDTSTVRRVLVKLGAAGVEIAVRGAPADVEALIERLRPCLRPGNANGCFSPLTTREAMVATLVGRGLTNQQIAHRLRISPHTVNFHLRQIFRKLEIPSRVHLATLACGGHERVNGDRRD